MRSRNRTPHDWFLWGPKHGLGAPSFYRIRSLSTRSVHKEQTTTESWRPYPSFLPIIKPIAYRHTFCLSTGYSIGWWRPADLQRALACQPSSIWEFPGQWGSLCERWMQHTPHTMIHICTHSMPHHAYIMQFKASCFDISMHTFFTIFLPLFLRNVCCPRRFCNTWRFWGQASLPPPAPYLVD